MVTLLRKGGFKLAEQALQCPHPHLIPFCQAVPWERETCDEVAEAEQDQLGKSRGMGQAQRSPAVVREVKSLT